MHISGFDERILVALPDAMDGRRMAWIAGGAVVEFSTEIDDLQGWPPFVDGNGRSRRFDQHADVFPARLQDGHGAWRGRFSRACKSEEPGVSIIPSKTKSSSG